LKTFKDADKKQMETIAKSDKNIVNRRRKPSHNFDFML